MWLAIGAAVLCARPAAADPLDFHAGIGARGGLRDPLAAVAAGKIRVVDFGAPSLSLRPAILVGAYFEARLSFTAEYRASSRLAIFAGAGGAYNTDAFGALDPMVVGGIEVVVTDYLGVSFTGDQVFQIDASDRDTEFYATINYLFP